MHMWLEKNVFGFKREIDMEDKNLYPREIKELGERCIQMIKSGIVRNHRVVNNIQNKVNYNRELEDELSDFNDFLNTKNCEIVINLRGRENYL